MNFTQSLALCICSSIYFLSNAYASQNTPHVEKVSFLGVSASTLPERMSEQLNLPSGIHLSVDQVSPESPADLAGLKLYDVLLKLDDQILVNSAQLKALVRMKNPGDKINLEILRKGSPITLSATLSETDQSSMPKNSQTFGVTNPDIFSGDPFSPDFNQFMPRLDPSIRDLLKRHGFSHLPMIDPDSLGFDLDSPLHGSSSNSDNVQSFTYSSEQKQITTSDEQGTLEYTLKDNQKHLRATSPEGKILFEGSITTDKEREKLSPTLKERLEKIENNL